MSPWLDDGDIRLYHGDALETVRQLPDASVDCVVTSPPYWGLRDYGTGEWDGADPDCDHMRSNRYSASTTLNAKVTDGASEAKRTPYGDKCGKCGARRVDRQMGLEPTPDLFVAGMVELFREIRRVLAPHGTCWVNLGDSYAASMTSDRHFTQPTGPDGTPATKHPPQFGGQRTAVGGLKPKDLVGAPWRVAFALQDDGWWLRSDIIWAKPNPMPESVTDRPTKSHEYVFLLTKQPRYWFDAEAVREPYQPATIERDRYGYNHAFANQFKGSPTDERHPDGKQLPPGSFAKGPDGRKNTRVVGQDGSEQHRNGERWPNAGGRNVRSVWQIATQPYPEAHFATYPEELARRCILAGCPTRVCRVCGKPSERIVERQTVVQTRKQNHGVERADGFPHAGEHRGLVEAGFGAQFPVKTVGWSDCGHNNWRPGVTLDPFIGSGTTAKVARDHQRHAIGIDLNQTYLELAARRLQQLSLLT